MPNSICFLCLKLVDDNSPSSRTKSTNLRNKKKPRRIRILDLHELFRPYLFQQNVPKFEEHETCSLCSGCSLWTQEAEEIRDQISNLEARLRDKVDSIKTTILESDVKTSGIVEDREFDRILSIRNSFLDVNQSSNVPVENFLVKEEHEESDNDFLDDDPPFSPPADDHDHHKVEQANSSDPESSFCIMPDLILTRVRVPKRESPPASPPSSPDSSSNYRTSVLRKTSTRLEYKPPPRRRSARSTKSVGMSQSVKDFFEGNEESDDDEQLKYTVRAPARPPVRGKKRKKPVDNKDIPNKEELDTNKDNSDPDCANTRSGRRLKRSAKSKMSKDVKEFFETKESSDDDEPLFKRAKNPDEIDKDFRNVASRNTRNIPTPWKCTICNLFWSSEETLNNHLSRRKPCPLCPFLYCSSAVERAHAKEAHATSRMYNCPHCKKASFRRQNDLDSHLYMRHETGEKKYQCPQCDKKFSLEYNYHRHVRLHKVEETRSFVCEVCDSRFSTLEIFDKHKKTHVDSYNCDLCDYKCIARGALIRHKRLHTGERPYKCPHCHESFIDGTSRQGHIFRVHEARHSLHCHICPKIVATPASLKAHLDRHAGKIRVKKDVPCASCNAKFKSIYSMQAHRVKVHGDAPLVCDECGGTYPSMHALKNHQRSHGEKLFKCDICDTAFISKAALASHAFTHTDQRPHACPSCSNRYRKNGTLAIHMIRVHNMDYDKETPNKCVTCGKGFPTKALLNWHIRQLHTGDGPKYTCTHCDAIYADSTMLTWHIRGHHGLMVGGQRKHRKHWKVSKPKKKTDMGSSSASVGASASAGGSNNNLMGSVIVDGLAVWGVDINMFG